MIYKFTNLLFASTACGICLTSTVKNGLAEFSLTFLVGWLLGWHLAEFIHSWSKKEKTNE